MKALVACTFVLACAHCKFLVEPLPPSTGCILICIQNGVNGGVKDRKCGLLVKGDEVANLIELILENDPDTKLAKMK